MPFVDERNLVRYMDTGRELVSIAITDLDVAVPAEVILVPDFGPGFYDITVTRGIIRLYPDGTAQVDAISGHNVDAGQIDYVADARCTVSVTGSLVADYEENTFRFGLEGIYAAPALTGSNIADVIFDQNSGDQVVQTAAAVSGQKLVFSYTPTHPSIAIAAGNGDLTIQDDTVLSTIITVSVTNERGDTPVTFPVNININAAAVSAPTNTSAPTLTGTAQEGQSLTGDEGLWTGAPTLVSVIQTSPDGANPTTETGWTDDPDASPLTFEQDAADIGRFVRLKVSATNGGGGPIIEYSAVSGPVTAAGAVFTATQAPESSSLYDGQSVSDFTDFATLNSLANYSSTGGAITSVEWLDAGDAVVNTATARAEGFALPVTVRVTDAASNTEDYPLTPRNVEPIVSFTGVTNNRAEVTVHPRAIIDDVAVAIPVTGTANGNDGTYNFTGSQFADGAPPIYFPGTAKVLHAGLEADLVAGDDVTFDPGIWFDDASLTITWQGKSNGANIGAADALAFTLTAAEIGTDITLEVSADDGTNAPVVVTSNTVTAGTAPAAGKAIFLLVGQSNVADRATFDGGTDFPANVFQVGRYAADDGLVVPAVRPLQHWTQPTAGGMGFNLQFALDYQAANANQDIIFIPGAYGGNGFATTDSFRVGQNLYLDALAKANIALAENPANYIAGIHFLGGSADSNNQGEVDAFAGHLVDMVNGYRTEFGDQTIPVVVGKLADDSITGGDLKDQINDAIDTIPSLLPYSSIAATDTSTTSDGIHFDAAGQRVNGSLYFAGMATAAANVPTAPDQITTFSVIASDTQELTLSWAAPNSFGSAITDYVIEQTIGAGTPTIVADGVSAVAGYVAGGLTNGTAHSYRVAAVNATGQGPFSALVTETPVATSTPFTPLSLATTKFWQDGTDELKLTKTGNEVSGLENSIAAEADLAQTTSPLRPTHVGGDDFLSFTHDQYLEASSRFGLSANPALVLSMLLEITDMPDANERVFSLGGTDSMILQMSVGTGGYSWRFSGASKRFVTPVVGGLNVVTWVRPAGGDVDASDFYLNGIIQTPVATSGGTNLPLSTTADIKFGRGDGTGGIADGFQGRIYSTVLAETSALAEVQKIEGYIAHAHTQQAVLDASHPYRTLPPTE